MFRAEAAVCAVGICFRNQTAAARFFVGMISGNFESRDIPGSVLQFFRDFLREIMKCLPVLVVRSSRRVLMGDGMFGNRSHCGNSLKSAGYGNVSS